MTEKLRQSLSAAIDDEADAFELRRVLDELGRDPELRSLWDRYHLIGSVLRGDRTPVPANLRERVWEALQDGADESATPAPVLPEAPPASGSRPAAEPRSRLGRYTGLAVAASVAFAVVLGLNGVWDDADVTGGGGLIASESAGILTGPSAPALPAVDDAPMGTEVSAMDVQRAQAYMLHHTQQQALNQTGVMSFVKLATYEAP